MKKEIIKCATKKFPLKATIALIEDNNYIESKKAKSDKKYREKLEKEKGIKQLSLLAPIDLGSRECLKITNNYLKEQNRKSNVSDEINKFIFILRDNGLKAKIIRFLLKTPNDHENKNNIINALIGLIKKFIKFFK